MGDPHPPSHVGDASRNTLLRLPARIRANARRACPDAGRSGPSRSRPHDGAARCAAAIAMVRGGGEGVLAGSISRSKRLALTWLLTEPSAHDRGEARSV